MFTSLFKNPKTTFAGLGAALITLLGPQVATRLQCTAETVQECPAPPITSGNVLNSLGLLILGALAKDHNVTGGTKEQ